jgi:hypothetical protein
MTSIPPFLRKLWDMVNDNGNETIICWLEDGDGFKVPKPRELSTQILPKYFNGTLCSFVRQLNLYGFNKIGDDFAFKHYDGLFKRGQEDKLVFIERRKNIKTRSRNTTDSENGSNAKQKKLSKSQKSEKSLSETLPPPTTSELEYPISKLITTSQSHDFMINWLTTELQQQQRETAQLKQQLSQLTQFVITHLTPQNNAQLPPPQIPNGHSIQPSYIRSNQNQPQQHLIPESIQQNHYINPQPNYRTQQQPQGYYVNSDSYKTEFTHSLSTFQLPNNHQDDNNYFPTEEVNYQQDSFFDNSYTIGDNESREL